MSRLLGAELNRWFSRRLIWVVLVSSAVLALLVVGVVALSNQPMSAAEIAAAERDYAEAVKTAQGEVERCIAAGEPAEDCELYVPQRSDFVGELPSYVSLVGGLGQAGTMIAAYAALLAAASFVGAEFKTGSLATWLTYVPDRPLVLASKAVAAVIGSLAIGVTVMGILQAGAAGMIAAWSGPSALAASGEAWALVGRGLVLVVGAGLAGFAVATLFGSTIAPVGVLLGLMVAQWALGLIALLMGVPVWLQFWLPDPNLQAFVNGSSTIVYVVRAPDGSMVEQTATLGLAQASLYLGGLLSVTLVAAAWGFLKREIR